MADESLLLIDQPAESVTRLTFNRPERRNAMNAALREQIMAALTECEGRAKVIVLTGRGSAFCAGMDLKESTEPASPGGERAWRSEANGSWIEVQQMIRRHSAVTIAAVNGYALGGGSTLINVCDLAIAADTAQIGMPEMGFGSYPGVAAPAMQLRIAPKRAAYMVLTARRVDGPTAEQWGIVNKSVPLADLEAESLALATHIAQFDPVTLAESKRALWTVPWQVSDFDEALQVGSETNARIKARNGTSAGRVAAFVAGERNTGQGAQ